MTTRGTAPLLLLLLLSPAWASRAAAAPGDHPAAALLEAEYVTADTRADRTPLTAWLDTLLTQSLAEQKDLTLVDRQALNKVLAEQNLQRLDARSADPALRPFIAAGLLICPTITADAKTGKAVVTVQVVLAQRGTLLAEATAAGAVKGDAWTQAPALGPALEQLWKDTRRGLESNVKFPGLEVRRITVKSRLDRLQWLGDDLTDALAAAPRPGVVLLTPCQTVNTKEERLLRLMGLSAPGAGDQAGRLAAASDYQLAGELSEEAKTDVPFAQTPLKLTLHLAGGGKELATAELTGTTGGYAALRAAALAWAGEQLAKAGNIKTPLLDEAAAQAQAQQELAAAKRLMAVSYGQGPMEIDRAERIASAVLRAQHLDPTCEEAAFLAVREVGNLYWARGSGETLAAKDRLIAEGQRYLDRFKDSVPEHHGRVLDALGSAANSAAWVLRGQPGGTEAVGAPPDTAQYPYVRLSVWAWFESAVRAEHDPRYSQSNALTALPIQMRLHLIPNIPDDKLDEEYAFWRDFWKARIEKLGDKGEPWALLEVAFQARRKNPQGVRQALQTLAEKYVSSDYHWRLLRDNIIPLYLRAAGDKEADTWQPRWPAGKTAVTFAEHTAFYNRLMPAALDLMDLPNLPKPGKGLTRLVFDGDILKLGRQTYVVPYPRIEPLAEVGGDLWLVAPGLWGRSNLKQDQALLVISLAQIQLDAPTIALKPVRVDWPARTDSKGTVCINRWLAAPDGNTFWIGTRAHGIARFTRTGGAWSGQWIGQHQGLPVGAVTGMAWKGGEASSPLRVEGLGPLERVVEQGKPVDHQQQWVCEIDPKDNTVRLVEEKPAPPMTYVLPPEILTTIDGGAARTWELPVGRFIDAKRWQFREIEPQTKKTNGPVMVGRMTRSARSGDLSFASSLSPFDEPRQAASAGPALWISSHWEPGPEGNIGQGEVLAIYQPAPPGDKAWRSHDRWIIAFYDTQHIFGLLPGGDGRFWITTGEGIYVTDWRRYIADRQDAAMSTEQWRQADQERRRQSEWRLRARQFLSEKQTAQAQAVVDEQAAGLTEVTAASALEARQHWTVVQFYKAILLAQTPATRNAAAEVYRMLATCPWVEPAARQQAWLGAIGTLSDAERWADVLKTAEEGSAVFPEVSTHSWYVDHARHMLARSAATQPATAPAPTPNH